MIVVDASALLEFLLQTPLGTRVEARLFRNHDEFHSPHLASVDSYGQARCRLTGRPRRLQIWPISISTVIPTSIS